MIVFLAQFPMLVLPYETRHYMVHLCSVVFLSVPKNSGIFSSFMLPGIIYGTRMDNHCLIHKLCLCSDFVLLEMMMNEHGNVQCQCVVRE